MQVLILRLLPVVAVSVIPLNVLICSLCLERIMRNKVIKSCEIGALACIWVSSKCWYVETSLEGCSVLAFPRKYLPLKICQHAH